MSQRLLKVTIPSAKDLVSSTAVIAKVALLDLAGRELKKELHKTKKSSKSNNPEFPTHSFELGSTYNLSNESALPTVEISITTTSTTGLSNVKTLGVVKIPLDTIEQHAEEQDCEYDLLPGSDSSISACGSVRVKFTWSAALNANVGEGDSNMTEAEVITEDDHPDESPNELHVSVLSAKDLMIMDKSFSGKGSSDPRINLKLGKTKFKTTTIEKNLNPVWNEKFVFPCYSVEESLEIVVEDIDMLANDFMGKVSERANYERAKRGRIIIARSFAPRGSRQSLQ